MGELEIVTRRRKWSPEEKAAFLAEIEAEGGRVSVVARRHGISESLLYNWRAAWKAAMAMRGPEPMDFVPLGVIGAVAEPSLAFLPTHEQSIPTPTGGSLADRSGLIEIDLPGGARVRVDASVSEKALARVFRAMKGAM